MKACWIRGIVTGCLLAAQAVSAAPPAAVPPASKRPLEVSGVTLRIRHRVFASFREDRRVRPKEVFQVGDTDYSAQIVRFVPDFAMNLETRKVATRSAEPKNPAFQVAVWEKKAPQDTTWAFLNAVPHFARKSMLAFQVLRVEFTNHEPVVSPDSAEISPPPAPGAAPSGPRTSAAPPPSPAGKK